MKIRQSPALLAGLFVFVFFPFQAEALTVDSIQALSFGTVIADPSNHETIEIDARFGPASTVKTSTGFSVISTPGHSGAIRINSDLAFSCTLFFPAAVTLNGIGDTMQVDRLSVLSMTGGSIPGDGVLDLTIGGRLNIRRGQTANTYAGSAIIMVIIE